MIHHIAPEKLPRIDREDLIRPEGIHAPEELEFITKVMDPYNDIGIFRQIIRDPPHHPEEFIPGAADDGNALNLHLPYIHERLFNLRDPRRFNVERADEILIGPFLFGLLIALRPRLVSGLPDDRKREGVGCVDHFLLRFPPLNAGLLALKSS